MKQLAIIGSTASGKSDFALTLAQEMNALILSIDSLSIYKTIDIASAKPSPKERATIEHFGIDVLLPSQRASVFTFIDEYHRIIQTATEHEKNVIIVGGSSFYLKSMLHGLSYLPEITQETKTIAADMLHDVEKSHHFLAAVDPVTMTKIAPTDPYRIEKMLHLYLQTSIPPSQWFATHPPKPLITHCPILALTMERSLLRERIALRTTKMIASGIIDEVAQLERLYGRSPNSMKAIGIIETLDFLDGKISLDHLVTLISTHTAQLAKRQNTFNTHQFSAAHHGSVEGLYDIGKALLTF